MNDAQQRLLDHFQLELQAYHLLVLEVVRQRKSAEWNLAHFWLREHALPRSREINRLLEQVAGIEAERMRADSGLVSRVGRTTPPILLGLLGLMVISAWFLARRGAESTLGPIRTVVEGSRRFAEGDLSEDLPVTSSDELGLLSRSFNSMRRSLQQQQESLRMAEAETRSIIETANEGIISIDQRAGCCPLTLPPNTSWVFPRKK